ncbi:MAG: GIY-YIG nuclease family protein [Candidatus Staskawiczbacteria bacterium]|nr:GIY-YIG nuclease family protein [Candidatus Staskawiczbacteria bacterium]
MYYVYAIYDKISGRFYIGYTGDLQKRILEHKYGNNLTTKKMLDQELVYYEASVSKKDAEAREKQLKTGFGRGYLKRRLKDYLS